MICFYTGVIDKSLGRRSMKKGAIRFIALLAIFIVSMAGFFYFFNRDKEKAG